MSVYLHFTDTKSLSETIKYTDAWADGSGETATIYYILSIFSSHHFYSFYDSENEKSFDESADEELDLSKT